MLYEDNYLAHYGIKGQKWGVRRFQNDDGTLTKEGKQRYNKNDTIFVSGSSKTQDINSGYYRKDLPKQVKKEINEGIKAKSKFVVGDAPGIDRQVQDYLNKKNYNNVEIYGPGTNVRYSANKKWKTNTIDDPDHEPMSPEWLAKKDIAMTNASTKGLAIVLDHGAQATRNNIDRLKDQNKDVKVFSLNLNEKDDWSESYRHDVDKLVREGKQRRLSKEELDQISKTSEQIYEDGDINFNPMYDATDKLAYKATNAYENDKRIQKADRFIAESIKNEKKEFDDTYNKLRNIKGLTKKEREQNKILAVYENSIAYKKYADKYGKTVMDYITKNFSKDERDLVLAAIYMRDFFS